MEVWFSVKFNSFHWTFSGFCLLFLGELFVGVFFLLSRGLLFLSAFLVTTAFEMFRYAFCFVV